MNDKFEIIYIIGAGRSGSTLLDIIIGNNVNHFSCGELNRFSERNGQPHNPRDIEVSNFWNEVYLKVRHFFPQIKSISRKMEYHFFFLHKFFLTKAKKETYIKFNKELFDSIYINSKYQKIIIDSGKYPFRALQLYKIFGNQVKFIYLKKSPLEVVESFQKRDLEQPNSPRFLAHLYLFYVNCICKIVFKKIKSKKVEIFYDDLLYNLPNCLMLIEKKLDISLENLINKIERNEDFDVGLLFDSNRIRLNYQLKIIKIKKKIKKLSLLDVILLRLHKIFWF
jgi:hypothetical protein